MVTQTPTRPLPLLILHLDQGDKEYAGKTINFKGATFIAKVLSFGTVERTIPYPTGLISVPDATVEVEDTDGQIRAWFDERTPLRRIAEIAFEFEANNSYLENLQFPIEGYENQEGPNSEQVYRPFFTGEIVGVPTFPNGSCIIQIRDATSAWLGRTIPNLCVRDNFPNMPDDVESAFAPIIFGRVASQSAVGLEPQGVIKCHHIDTTLNRYVVARHKCYSVLAVYRKKKLDARFHLVAASEYSIVEAAKTINGISYTFTYIQFATQQFDGTDIHADVSGVNYRWDFDTEATVTGVEVRDFVDSIVNLIFFLLQDEVTIQRFDGSSFADTRTRTTNYKCDGAITDQCTNGLALSRLCGDAVIDFYQTNRGIISIHLYDDELDAESIVPLDDDLILKKSLVPRLATDKVKNRIRYRYARQNAGLSEFRKNTNTGQWGLEYTVDNVADQAELAATGANPLLEEQVELFFVRDDNTAQRVIKQRMRYMTLRSYVTDLTLSGPVVIDYVSLAKPVAVTGIWGIGPAHSSPSAGWVDKVLKIFGISFDLTTFEAKISAVVPAYISDASLDWSIDDAHDAHDTQTRNPHIAAIINGNLIPVGPSASLINDADASPVADFNDTTPAAPTSMQNITWQSSHHGDFDEPLDPRLVSGYVPGFAPITGTLSPDTKPTGLTEAQAGKVLFYAKDFDHYFLWIGRTNPLSFVALAGETFDSSEGALDGNTTGWRITCNDIGMVTLRLTAPTTAGWALLNGDVITSSTPDGQTANSTYEDCRDGTRFLRLTSSFVPPSSSLNDAVAPVISGGSVTGTTGSVADHTHSLANSVLYMTSADTYTAAGVPKSAGHTHTLSGSSGSTGAHTHTYSGSTSSDGYHDHSATIADESAHTHVMSHSHNATHTHGVLAHGFTGTYGGFAPSGTATTDSGGAHTHTGTTASSGAHTHAFSGETDEAGSHTHVVEGSTTLSYSDDFFDTLVESSGNYAITSVGVSAGYSVDADGVHTHTFSGTTDSDGAHTHTFTTASSGAHTHDITITLDSGGSHNHTIDSETIVLALTASTAAGSAHAHGITIDLGGEHGHTFSGTSSSDGSHSHTLASGVVSTDTGHRHDFELGGSTVANGGHSHSFTGSLTGITAGVTGKPKAVGMMPYIRL